MAYKSKIVGGPRPDVWAGRFWHNFWLYRVGQITSGNMNKMLQNPISGSGGATPVVSDIQPFVIHTFKKEFESNVVIVVRKNSPHVQNFNDLGKASVMVGHTDPQIFHWFKQLGSIPPRGLMTGAVEQLKDVDFDDAWWNSVVKHPTLHAQAKEMWEKDEGIGAEEREAMKKREEQRDMLRMERMTGSDWRVKHQEREKSPSPEDDIEAPLYVMNAEDFALYRVKPETLYFADAAGGMNRVRSPFPTERDPLVRIVPRFIRLVNLSRQKTLTSLNMNYNLKLVNMFAFAADKKGLYIMGTQEGDPLKPAGKEVWNEYFIEYGKGMEITKETDLEWWLRNLQRLGSQDVATNSSEVQEADPADTNFR
eukprot:PhF_6_TR35061/c0_g1_i1/m.51092